MELAIVSEYPDGTRVEWGMEVYTPPRPNRAQMEEAIGQALSDAQMTESDVLGEPPGAIVSAKVIDSRGGWGWGADDDWAYTA